MISVSIHSRPHPASPVKSHPTSLLFLVLISSACHQKPSFAPINLQSLSTDLALLVKPSLSTQQLDAPGQLRREKPSSPCQCCCMHPPGTSTNLLHLTLVQKQFSHPWESLSQGFPREAIYTKAIYTKNDRLLLLFSAIYPSLENIICHSPPAC